MKLEGRECSQAIDLSIDKKGKSLTIITSW